MSRTAFSASIRRSVALRWGTEHSVELVRGKDVVPATWILPKADRAIPAVLLLHGLSSHKDRMASSVGRALAKRGVASLALDLPHHGERKKENAHDMLSRPLALIAAWRAAVKEVEGAVNWLAEQSSVDSKRIGIVGYSLGGFLALMTAAEDERIGVIALAAAGDLPDATPYAAMVRGIVDPLRAVRRLEGRALLLVNGRRDTTTRPAQAERLFAAASEPKTMLWYDGGHWPQAAVIEQTAEWVASALSSDTRRARAG